MDEYIFFAVFWSCFAFLVWKHYKRKQKHLSPRQIIQYLDSIDDLYETAQKYRTIENMIIDLNNTDGRHLKNVTIDVPTLYDGKGRKYDFLCNGKNVSTKQLKVIAENEREQLLIDLFEKSEQLHKRHVTAVTLRRWGELPYDSDDDESDDTITE